MAIIEKKLLTGQLKLSINVHVLNKQEIKGFFSGLVLRSLCKGWGGSLSLNLSPSPTTHG
jgi:hypothetical protein